MDRAATTERATSKERASSKDRTATTERATSKERSTPKDRGSSKDEKRGKSRSSSKASSPRKSRGPGDGLDGGLPATTSQPPEVITPIMCTQCVGLTAYYYCESCLDSFCTACWHGIHKGGALAKHPHYVIQQPEGYFPDTELLVRHLHPHEAVHAKATTGQELVQHEYLFKKSVEKEEEGEGEAAPKPRVRSEDMTEAQKQRAMAYMGGAGGGAHNEVCLDDLSKYLQRQRRHHSLASSLQMHIKITSKERVYAAAREIITVDSAAEVGGLGVLKNRKPDSWLTACEITGAGITKHM